MELSLLQAHGLCGVIASAFVLSLYVIPARVRALSRNDPEHIAYRLKLTVLVTIIFFLAIYTSSIRVNNSTFMETVGLTLTRLVWSILLTIALMSVFYAGKSCTYVCHNLIFFF
jgi:hypothetical protein